MRAILRLCTMILVSTAILSAAACASYFKRKECEKTNWYQHGFDVAMAGKRLDADEHVKQCQKVEATMSFSEMDVGFKAGMGKYCTDDNVYAVGKAGKIFSYEMCDGESVKKMRSRYNDGLKAFCTPNTAYRFGSQGGIYLNVCPKDVEVAWLSEYFKGRKIWLKAVIVEKQLEIVRLEREINSLEGHRASLSHQQMSLSHMTAIHHHQVLDPGQTPDPQATLRIQQLSNEISSLDYQIQSKRQRQQDINSELSKLRTEFAALEG